MKKLWIETSFIFKPMTGIGVFTLNLISLLKLYDYKLELKELLLPQKLKFKFIYHCLWLNTIFLLQTLLKKSDIIIFPAFIMPFFTRRKTKYIAVIHDLCHLRNGEMSKYHKNIFDLSAKTVIKKADVIITVSQTVKNELIQLYRISPSRVKVVYNSIASYFINSNNNLNILEKYNIKNKKYILSVATLNKRKNIPELIKAFEQISDKYPDLKLVLVGGMGNENREKLTKHPNIIFTGYIPDEDVPTLYKNALLYMYPSLYEGFGIPLIEAQYCGCPVLCSDIPVFREIGGDSVEYCEPISEGIAKGLENLISNTERLQELSILGKENVKRFSIEKIAEQLKEVLNGQ